MTENDDAPARVLSRFEIVNVLTWMFVRAHDLRAGGCDPQHAFDRALQEHESTLAEITTRASVAVYGAARMVWASLADQDDARVLAWILERAAELREGGQARHDAIEQAIADCQAIWERATRVRTAEAHQVARYAWAAASKGARRVGPVLAALDTILGRALTLHQGGCDPGDAIAVALNEDGASHDVARGAFAAWALVVGEGEVSR